MKLYIIYDKQAETISPIYEAVSDTVAMRQFAYSLTRSPFPEDFSLHVIGEYEYDKNIDSVQVKPLNMTVCNGSDVLELIERIRSHSDKSGEVKK